MAKTNVIVNEKSKFKADIVTAEGQTVTFFFSSLSHRNKFVDRVDEEIRIVESNIINRYRVGCECDILALINFYCRLETKGFCILVNEEVVRWVNQIKLGGLKVMI